jgi:hypothetical protein
VQTYLHEKLEGKAMSPKARKAAGAAGNSEGGEVCELTACAKRRIGYPLPKFATEGVRVGEKRPGRANERGATLLPFAQDLVWSAVA